MKIIVVLMMAINTFKIIKLIFFKIMMKIWMIIKLILPLIIQIKIININEMNIKYLINENEEGINLLGKEFVNNNKENFFIIFKKRLWIIWLY